MNTSDTQRIIERFYIALDAIIELKRIRGISTYCRLYKIDRRNLYAQRKNLSIGCFEVSLLSPLVKDYGINAKWLLTGSGRMFDKEQPGT